MDKPTIRQLTPEEAKATEHQCHTSGCSDRWRWGCLSMGTSVLVCERHYREDFGGNGGRLMFFLAMKVNVKGNSKKIVKFGGRFSLIGDAKARAAEETLTARLTEHRPEAPLVGPVRLDVTFVMAIPKGWPRWKSEAALGGRILPETRPDRGNALKLIEDAMSGMFYVDDSQVVAGDVSKVYGEIPGYQIGLEALPQATRESEAARTT